jgi:O-antigen/teichoic acid export membrane protein
MTVAGLRTRLLKGIGANLYGQVIVAIIQLASVPILLHCWGVRTYGQWLLLTAVPSYLSMTDLGFSISAANDMTAQVAQGNRSGALAVFHSITALIVASCAVMLGLIAAALWFTPA